MTNAEQLVDYLKKHKLTLTTAESCTAGTIIALLADVEGCGEVMDCGYIVYSPESKQRLLNVQQTTIDAFTLTSEEVAREMVAGALRDSTANVAVATTGVAGPEPMDGIPPGTVCVAWGFQHAGELSLFSRTIHLRGEREEIRRLAAEYAIGHIDHFHRRVLSEARE